MFRKWIMCKLDLLWVRFKEKMCNILTNFCVLMLGLCFSFVCLIIYEQSNLSCCVRRGGVAWHGMANAMGFHDMMVVKNFNLTGAFLCPHLKLSKQLGPLVC